MRNDILKGEWAVLEDDMDVYPYDLSAVMAALGAGDIEAVRREFRPLRGQFDRQPMGSDLRYPILAYCAGHRLMGDPDVRPGHVTGYPVEAGDYTTQSAATYATLLRDADEATANGRAKWAAYMESIGQ